MLRALRLFSQKIFEKPALQAIARDELYQAERELLSLRTAREYTQGLIDYREKQIARLKTYIQTLDSK